MEKMRLGRTGINAARCGFGALPIQRCSREEAVYLLRKAYDNGINFFDTARNYTDSEEKIGYALADVRPHIFIATKSGASDGRQLLRHLEQSLQLMRTDCVDIMQLHNPGSVPEPGGEDGLYDALLSAREKGLIRFIGFSNHRLSRAVDAACSGLYDTVQFPLNTLSSAEDLALAEVCREHDIGLIAMKGLSGGLLTNARAAFAFLRQYENVLPIWGVQRERELDEFLAYERNPPRLDEALQQAIAKDRAELAGEFCRGCGYCLPCPAGIPINMAARIILLMRRMPSHLYLTPDWRKNMALIEECQECGQCRERCPYGLDPPALLKKNWEEYQRFSE